jgi:hypothetical protein
VQAAEAYILPGGFLMHSWEAWQTLEPQGVLLLTSILWTEYEPIQMHVTSRHILIHVS